MNKKAIQEKYVKLLDYINKELDIYLLYKSEREYFIDTLKRCKAYFDLQKEGINYEELEYTLKAMITLFKSDNSLGKFNIVHSELIKLVNADKQRVWFELGEISRKFTESERENNELNNI